MINWQQTYKFWLTSILLLGYIIGNFSNPILEGVHFLMHLNDEAASHSFHSHTNQHSHEVLDLMHDLSRSDSPIVPATIDNLKKNYQIKETIAFLTVPSILKENTFPNHSLYLNNQFVRSIPFPPPKI